MILNFMILKHFIIKFYYLFLNNFIFKENFKEDSINFRYLYDDQKHYNLLIYALILIFTKINFGPTKTENIRFGYCWANR